MDFTDLENKTFITLLVEDNHERAELIKRVFLENNVSRKLYHAKNGEEALVYLCQSGDGENACPRPDIILIDHDLATAGGLETLKQIKSSNKLKNIPVVILSSYEREQDITESYKMGANSFLVKPVMTEDFANMIKNFIAYWSSWNRSII